MTDEQSSGVGINLSTEVTRLSESISKPVERLFQVGGLVLVFVFLGFLLMIVGNLFDGNLSNWSFVVGATVVFSCLCLFLFGQLYVPSKAKKIIKENKEMIDTVQDISIRMTESISEFQSLMFKHSEQVAIILETASPLLSQIPLVNRLDFTKTQNINSLIINATENSRVIIDDVKEALITCNITNLKRYSKELESINFSFREALRKDNYITQGMKNYQDISTIFKQSLLEYNEIINLTNSDILIYIDRTERVLNIARNLPFVRDKLDQIWLESIHKKSVDIREIAIRLQNISNKFENSLKCGDIKSFVECAEELKDFKLYVHGTIKVKKI
jgi:hypothetical protein